MKEVILTQVEGGYIVRILPEQTVKIATNFGSAVRFAREVFGEVIERPRTDVISAA